MKTGLGAALGAAAWPGGAALAADENPSPRVAAIVTSYYHNSHADVIVSRLLQTDTLDGQGRAPRLKLVSLYTDQVPANDVSRKIAGQYGIPIYDTIAGALTQGMGTQGAGPLAVDGVLLIAEHGTYPLSDKGQILYPKRRFFSEIAAVIERSGRPVPVFIDKHLGAAWEESKWIYDRAAELKIPLLAGSSVPLTWRHPPADVRAGSKIGKVMALNFGPLEAYGFHSLEMVQCLVERRATDQQGVRAVRCTSGKAVWDSPALDKRMLAALLPRLQERPIPPGKTLAELAREAVLFELEYRDGLTAQILTANDAISEWTCAWQLADGTIDATVFWTQEARPMYHFARLVEGIETFVNTGKAPWPVERTLLVSGVLDALMTSRHEGGRRVETPQLDFDYRSSWQWQEPPTPPTPRPLDGQ